MGPSWTKVHITEALYIIHHKRAPELSKKAKLPVTSRRSVAFGSRLKSLVNQCEEDHVGLHMDSFPVSGLQRNKKGRMKTYWNFQVIHHPYSQTSEPLPDQSLRDTCRHGGGSISVSKAALMLSLKQSSTSGSACILFTGVSCQRCKALWLCLNTKNTSLLPWIGSAASYREQVWLQECSSWEVDAIWLSLSGWLWLSVIDWWLIDRWRRGKGYSMSARHPCLLFQSSNFCGVCSYHGGNFPFSPTGTAASMSSRPEVCKRTGECGGYLTKYLESYKTSHFDYMTKKKVQFKDILSCSPFLTCSDLDRL